MALINQRVLRKAIKKGVIPGWTQARISPALIKFVEDCFGEEDLYHHIEKLNTSKDPIEYLKQFIDD